MRKLPDEIKYDLSFLKSHSLQPKWFKILKVFILLGFLEMNYFLFGFTKTILFFVSFIILSTLVHLIYRAKTHKWTKSWLDFIIVEENGELTTKRIGKPYYLAVIINVILSLIISQLLA
jgi:hypothetical protein